jgi:hypothetical protein
MPIPTSARMTSPAGSIAPASASSSNTLHRHFKPRGFPRAVFFGGAAAPWGYDGGGRNGLTC